MNQFNADFVSDKENAASNPDRLFSISCGANPPSSPNSYRQNDFASPRSHCGVPMTQGYPVQVHYVSSFTLRLCSSYLAERYPSKKRIRCSCQIGNECSSNGNYERSWWSEV